MWTIVIWNLSSMAAGAFVTWGVAAWYYRKAAKELKEEAENLRRVVESNPIATGEIRETRHRSRPTSDLGKRRAPIALVVRTRRQSW